MPACPALLRLGIDGFRAINESVGPAGGDAVLRQFASRLRACVREIDVVARYADDEFVIVQEGLSGDQQASTVASEILVGMQLPFRIGNNDLTVSTSIGLTLFSGVGESADDVIRRACDALNDAKAAGRGQLRTR